MAIGGAVIAAGSAFASSRAQKKEGDKARKAAELKPFSSSSTFGSAQFTPSGITSQGGVGADKAGIFDSLTGDFLSQVGGQDIGTFNTLSPEDAQRQIQGFGAAAQPFTAAGSNFLGAGQNFLGQLNQFDQGAFVDTQFDRLNQLAARGEATAAQSTAQRLFSGGRLGGDDSASGVAFGDLARAQEEARTSRGIQAIGLGDQRAQLLAGLAGGLTSTGVATSIGGQDFANAGVNRFLSSIQGGGAVAGIQSGISGSLLNQAIQTQGGVVNAQAGERQATQDALAGAGINTSAGANVASVGVAGLNNAGQALSSFGGAIGGALIDRFGSKDSPTGGF